MKKKIILCAVLFLFLNFNHLAFSQTLRCGGRIIKEGMSKPYVLEHCKDPEHKDKKDFISGGARVEIEKLYFTRGGRTIIVEIRMDEVTNISWGEE